MGWSWGWTGHRPHTALANPSGSSGWTLTMRVSQDGLAWLGSSRLSIPQIQRHLWGATLCGEANPQQLMAVFFGDRKEARG